jgi:Asp-tRNA(Asn)/Glu-tRNA(Gln) amidotransferase A subunit family amidase
MSIEELANLSVAELVGAYTARRLSPVEVLKATLEQAERVNPAINALFCLRPETAMAVARASEARWKERTPLGLLDGVPISVADSIAIAGWPRPCGVKANQNLPPSTSDAPAACVLRESGAPIFAKTTMPDFGLLASGVSSMHGVTRNPWDAAWNTGGPSSGAGAALAAGVGHLAIGADVAGSMHLAAAYCGLAALKPTQDRTLHLPADRMRTAGPMRRRIEDIARLLSVLKRPDERGARRLPRDATRYHEQLGRDIKGLRIGVLTDMGFGVRPETLVCDSVEAAAKALASAGAIVEPFASPFDYDA